MFLRLPFYNQQINFKDILAVLFSKDSFSALEDFLKNYFASENIILAKSGRQGIKLILESLNLEKDDEVIVSSFICPAVPEAVLRAGAKPVFCDIEQDGFNMDIESAKILISPRTRAIILAHLFGIPAPVDKFLELARGHKLILIEDCAHSLGAEYQGKLLGTFGDFAIFSLGFSKNVGGLDGGFILCKDKANFQKIKEAVPKKGNFSLMEFFELIFTPLVFNKYFYFLFDKRVKGYGQKRSERRNEIEFSSSLSNLEAKIALQKLGRYEKDKKRKNANALIYQQGLKNIFSFPQIPAEGEPAYPYFPVLAPDKTFYDLRNKNIPVERLDFGNLEKDARFSNLKFFNSNEKKIQQNYFLLPLNYSPKEIKRISKEILKILSK